MLAGNGRAADETVYDITIIGGGPTGLFAAYYAGERDASCKVIDSLDQLGGQLAALYPEKTIYDVGGFPEVLAKELAHRLVQQALQRNPTVCLGEQVLQVDRGSDGVFRLTTTRGTHFSRALVVAAGVGAMTPRRLHVPGAAELEGRGLAYHVPSLEPYRGSRVLVVGGGDSAVDWALMLEPVADGVVLIHRRPGFRAHETSVRKLKESRVRVLTPYELRALHGVDQVEGATVFQNQTGEEGRLDVNRVVVSIGFDMDLGPIRDWGLAMDENGIVVDTRMATSVPGIYAAGDLASYPGKLKLIATGFGEAATAVNHAKTFIDPKARLFAGHSTSRKH
ncbi:ferredoxin-NADP reductase [Limnochorda pilosa]|uniref:Ferredoxin--NADP reductase n=1 Tax=Limnochorda pilosa TaxID=1555112 RepID=A0A0K2SPS8_LIMPI|nr:ferredoxin-NADP reductase [Limnochorda pilosa]